MVRLGLVRQDYAIRQSRAAYRTALEKKPTMPSRAQSRTVAAGKGDLDGAMAAYAAAYRFAPRCSAASRWR